jgi:hypothetical protein
MQPESVLLFATPTMQRIRMHVRENIEPRLLVAKSLRNVLIKFASKSIYAGKLDFHYAQGRLDSCAKLLIALMWCARFD